MSLIGLLLVLLIVLFVVRRGPDQITNAIYVLVILILIVWLAQLLGVAWPLPRIR
jgi:hypothetical protein